MKIYNGIVRFQKKHTKSTFYVIVCFGWYILINILEKADVVIIVLLFFPEILKEYYVIVDEARPLSGFFPPYMLIFTVIFYF